MAGARRFCTFYLDDRWFGLSGERVQEVLPAPIITPVPLAPHWIAGLVNLRGQIVTAIDLRRRLRLAERPGVATPEMLVVRREDGLVGLLVTRVDEVVEAAKDGFETEHLGQLVTAVCKFPDRLLHVLDLDRVAGDGKEAPFEIAVK